MDHADAQEHLRKQGNPEVYGVGNLLMDPQHPPVVHNPVHGWPPMQVEALLQYPSSSPWVAEV